MALLSTLQYGSTFGQPAGTGNYGGDLHLFFSKLNAADFMQGAGTPTWAGWNIGDTYTVPNGAITLNLNAVTGGGAPLDLVMVGDLSVQTSGGKHLGGSEIGEGGAAFVPGTPMTTLFQGLQSATTPDGITFTVGFELGVAWDGVSADCHGSWWASWH